MNVIFEACKNIRYHGIKKVIILNGHGGNTPAIRLVGFRVRDDLNMKVAAFSYWELLPDRILNEILEEKIVPGHAGEFETSTAMVIHPDLMRKDIIPRGGTIPQHLPYAILNEEEISPDGVEIDSSLGTPEKGKFILNAIIDELEKYLLRFIET
jgi:creatinine amidohydrolase